MTLLTASVAFAVFAAMSIPAIIPVIWYTWASISTYLLYEFVAYIDPTEDTVENKVYYLFGRVREEFKKINEGTHPNQNIVAE